MGNKSEIKYLVKFEKVRQISPEGHIEMYFEEKLFSENTILKDVDNWVTEKAGVSMNNPFREYNVSITVPEQEDLNNG